MPLLLALALAAQITPVQPIPKGSDPSPRETSDAGPMAAVDAVLRSMRTHDAATLLAHVTDPDSLGITAAPETTTSGFLHISWRAVAGGKDRLPGPEQRLTDPVVAVDGTIAMVWSRYVSLRDGKVWHCGFAHFDLIQIEGLWKVQSLTRSQHETGCPAQ